MIRNTVLAATGALALAGCGGPSAPDTGPESPEAPGTTAHGAASESAAPDALPQAEDKADPAPAAPAAPGPAAPSPTAPALAQPRPPLQPVAPPAPPAPPPRPAPPVAPLTTQEAQGEKGARAVLDTWARALESRQFGRAWEQFRDPPADRNAYAAWWQRYRTIHAELGDGSAEGAAGSTYYTVPVTLSGETAQGEPYRLEGTVVLRRVNDVPGASAAQRRWRIETADLKDSPPR